MDYNQLKLKSYKYWDLYLHENQCYLGRVFIQLRQDEGVEDFLAIKGAVRDEFFLIGEHVKAVLKILFNPDKLNYAALSNTSPKIHVHVVPRYKESREYGGVVFNDLRWGTNFAPYDRSFALEETTLFQIRDDLQRAFSIVDDFLIRPLHPNDLSKIVSRYSFPWTTSDKTWQIWETYYREQEEGIRTVAVIEKNSEILGYGSFLRKSECLYFASNNIPEVSDIWIDENHRRQGLGRALIKWMENLAVEEEYNQIGIGVGLYGDYGPAQKLYFQLGYIPDGNGITYKGEPTTPGQTYPLDDDLIFWLTKRLK